MAYDLIKKSRTGNGFAAPTTNPDISRNLVHAADCALVFERSQGHRASKEKAHAAHLEHILNTNTFRSSGATQLVSTFDKVRRRNPRTNLWFFHSPKNERRLAIMGDLPFYLIVLLEGDTHVQAYSVDDHAHACSTSCIRVRLRSGRTEVWQIRRKGSSGAGEVARALSSGALDSKSVFLKTDDEIRGRELFIDNWLLLCSAITRAIAHPSDEEIATLLHVRSVATSATFGELLDMGGDRSTMLAVVARALQSGAIMTDLDTKLFGESSMLTWGGADE